MTVTAVIFLLGKIYGIPIIIGTALGGLMDGAEGASSGAAVGFGIGSAITTGMLVVLAIVFFTGGTV